MKRAEQLRGLLETFHSSLRLVLRGVKNGASGGDDRGGVAGGWVKCQHRVCLGRTHFLV